MCVGSSCFCSVGRDAHASHLGGHGVAEPAAQGQQKDHEGKNQMAHTLMIVRCGKSSIRVLQLAQGLFDHRHAAA